MLVERKNKKSDSETSFLARERPRKCEKSRENELSNLLRRKLSQSLDDLNWRNSKAPKGAPFCRKDPGDFPTQFLALYCREGGLINYKRNKMLFYKAGATDDRRNKLAKTCIVNLLMLNAWRKQKASNKVILIKMENLNEKLEGFEMQVYLLRQLLNGEKARVESANENIQVLIQKIEECNKDRSEILKKRAEMERSFNDLSKYCSQMEGTLRNQANEIITSMEEAENWERQLEKEREKLKKVEGDEMLLREKVQLLEKAFTAKVQEMECLIQQNQELANKLAAQIQLWNKSVVQLDIANEELNESKAVRDELESALESRNEAIKHLSSTVSMLERKVREEDEKNGLLAKSILEKTKELCLIESKLQEISKNNLRWNRGFEKITAIWAKIPVACICTIGSLLLPFPSYRI